MRRTGLGIFLLICNIWAAEITNNKAPNLKNVKVEDKSKKLTTNPNKCEYIKCPLKDEPVCVKIKRKSINKEIYVMLLNKCEMKHSQCDKDLEVTIDNENMCDNHLHTKLLGARRRMKRAIFRAQKDKRKRKVKKAFKKNKSKKGKGEKKNKKKWVKAPKKKEKKQKKNKIDKKREKQKKKNDIMPPVGTVSKEKIEGFEDTNPGNAEPEYDALEADDNVEEQEFENNDEDDVEQVLVKSGEDLNLDEDDGNLAQDDGFIEKGDENEEQVYDGLDLDEYADGDGDEDDGIDTNDAKTSDIQTLKFAREFKDTMEEYPDLKFKTGDVNAGDANCPASCPVSETPVCAKCQHGIFRSFMSVCDMRKYSCKNPSDEILLVARRSCAKSMMYTVDKPPANQIVPGFKDIILQYAYCRELDLIGKRADCKF